MRIWFKLMKDTRLLQDITVTVDQADMTRTKKIFYALEQACCKLDLSQPIWLDRNITEFKRHNRTRFRQDSFIETIAFDFLEMHIIEE